jgi:iron complex outermembrane receptor protein
MVQRTVSGRPLPTVQQFSGSPLLESEAVVAYEAGLRSRLRDDLSLDLSVFYNDYDDLRGSRVTAPVCLPSATSLPCLTPGDDRIVIPVVFDNSLQGSSYGLELAADWRLSDRLMLAATYSYLRMDLRSENGNERDEALAGISPRHQASLRLMSNPVPNVDLDFWLRYVDTLQEVDVPAYLTLDIRLAWRPTKQLELSLAGRNLLDSPHVEFIELQNGNPATTVDASVHGQITWRF